jgi:hypothetical protein
VLCYVSLDGSRATGRPREGLHRAGKSAMKPYYLLRRGGLPATFFPEQTCRKSR